MKVGSLFSGIGGFDLGLERAGFEISWQVEIDEYCRQVLKKHWPAVPCHYDIRSIDWQWVQPVDLVCGGFPCQPFSCAGKRRGAADDRYLWPEVVRCLQTIRPAWFLGENVPGLLHLGIEHVCADLEALGYQVAVLGIPACAVGAPTVRQRLWICAYSDRNRLEANTNEEIICRSANGARRNGHPRTMGSSSEWSRPRPIGARPMGVDNGIPADVDRLRGLGNAIVPQIAEALGRMIKEASCLTMTGRMW